VQLPHRTLSSPSEIAAVGPGLLIRRTYVRLFRSWPSLMAVSQSATCDPVDGSYSSPHILIAVDH